MNFYTEIADDYDGMTNFDERLPREERGLRQWVDRYDLHTAVDMACGTGIHAIALARLGLDVTGVDISSRMLDQAKVNAGVSDVSLKWICSSMQRFREYKKREFDALFCLGNSIPHLLTRKELHKAFSSFWDCVRPGGIIVLQNLNYHRVMDRQERIVGISKSKDREYIRFYDFLDEHIRFNLLTVKWDGSKCSHDLFSTMLYPYEKEELTSIFQEMGVAEMETFGSMAFDPFEDNLSPNLVIVGKKQS